MFTGKFPYASKLEKNNVLYNWVIQIKDILYSSGFGYIWEQQTVTNKEKFHRIFETRCKDMYYATMFR